MLWKLCHTQVYNLTACVFCQRERESNSSFKSVTDVHGKVVHVVLRPPPAQGRPGGNDNAQPNSSGLGRDVNSVVVGSFSLPADMVDTNMVQVYMNI